MKPLSILSWIFRILLLFVLFNIFFIIGSMAVSGFIPNIQSEPGLLPAEAGILVISIVNVLLVIGLIVSSNWKGWKLIIALSLAYYGAVTFVMQIETWYFLSNITVEAKLLARLFIMGMPVALLFIPLSVLILGKGSGRTVNNYRTAPAKTINQWVLKLAVIAFAYLILYWCAGYFIAWQNLELRAFYGSPGEIESFWVHTINTLHNDPMLFPFQILRAMLWTICALPIIRGSRLNIWWTALLVGLFFSVPQNIAHILENPLLPFASVRLSHMIETASSTFIFGIIVSLLLYDNKKQVYSSIYLQS